MTKTEKFIEKAIERHGEKFDYSKVDYINSKKYIKIICKNHGQFLQTPSNHLKSSTGCPTCKSINISIRNSSNTQEFIEKAIIKYGTLDTYNLTNYEHSAKEVTITCSVHGNFQQKPDKYLERRYCKNCSKPPHQRFKLKTTEEFIKNAEKIHNKKYSYEKTKYTGCEKKVTITCAIHGDFEQVAGNHISGAGCHSCASKIKNTYIFIKEAETIHEKKYSYCNSKYLTSKDKVIITCKEHGDFEQLPSSHLKGKGCPKCVNNNRILGYSRTDYIKKANSRICTFYTIRCFNKDEEFYKIGITMRTTKERYNNIISMPYSYQIISEVFGEAGAIWDIEKEEIKKLKQFHYSPKIDFGGSKRECFTQYTSDEK